MKKITTLLALAFCLSGWAQCPITLNGASNPAWFWGEACVPYSYTITAGGATTYSWMPSATLSSSTGNTVAASPSVTTIYTITANTGTCTSISTFTLNAFNLPTPPVLSSPLSNPIITCQGDSVQLTVTSTDPATDIWWYNSPTAHNNLVSYGAYTYSFLANTANTTYYTVLDSGHCGGKALTVTVTISNSPTVSYTLVADAAPHTWDAYPIYSYNTDSAMWYWGDGTSTAGLYPSHTYSAAGTYSICVAAYSSCGDSVVYCQDDAVSRLGNNSPLSAMVYINVLQNTTGIAPLSVGEGQGVRLYPNPTKDVLNIEYAMANEKTTLTITDMLGNMVKQMPFTTQHVILNTTDLNEGIYNISLQSNEGVVNKRVVIVR